MDVVPKAPLHGWIEVITGSMFSGKSEELIRRLRRAQIARQKVQIFKPLVDNRFSEDHIVSHSDMRIGSETVKSSEELVQQVHTDTEVVGIDEGQFFDPDLPAACNTLADRGKRIIVAGLDQDYLGRPFEPMPQLLRLPNTSRRRSRSAWCAATRRTIRSGSSSAAIGCWSAPRECTRRAAAIASTRIFPG